MRNNKPSQTALKVALNIVTLSAKPDMSAILPSGIVDATSKLLLESGVAGKRTIRWTRSSKMVAIYEAFDWMLPGQFEAFGHRKAFCQRQVLGGIRSGATQVIVLGAGYDTVCWRLATEFPNVNFFEIDHPDTASYKVKGIEALGARENLFLIAEDLGEKQLVDVLGAHEEWDVHGQTVIIAEGLIMYLQDEAVRDLFSHCASIAGKGSRIAFSYIPSGADGRPYVGRWSGLMLWLQRIVGEPWLWSIGPEDLGAFLQKHGWMEAGELLEESAQQGVELFAVATT